MQLLEALQDIDTDVIRALNQAGSNVALDILMTAFTVMGISFVMATLALVLWYRGRKDLAIDYLVMIAIASFVAEVIKILTDRQRPFDSLPNVNTISLLGLTSASGLSFPSSHATRAFAVAALLSFGRGPRTYAVSLIVAAFVSVSRVYLGLHWPSDVLFGSLVGISLAITMQFFAGVSNSYRRARKAVIEFIERLTLSKSRSVALR